MPTMSDTSIPEDIEWTDLTDDRVGFLKRNFAQEAAAQGLVATFTTTRQDNGLETLVIHFARRADDPAPPAAEPGALAWGAKVSATFRNKVRTIASGLGTTPNFLMAAMAFETGRSFNPAQLNEAGSGAVGLIQFMPNTATALGTSSRLLKNPLPRREHIGFDSSSDRDREAAWDAWQRHSA